MLHDDDVLKIFNIDKQVGRESHSFLEFVRFEELANSVLVSRIEPKSNIIPLISEHFADRLHCENWIILIPDETSLPYMKLQSLCFFLISQKVNLQIFLYYQTQKKASRIFGKHFLTL